MTKQRVINGITVTVKTALLKVSQISNSTEFQYREDKHVDVRAREIARSVKNSESPRFRDNPILYQRYRKGVGDEYLIVDGFGRIGALEHLGREEVEVDILVGDSDKEETAHLIACVINTNNVSERGFKDKEIPRATAKLLSITNSKEKVAALHGVTVKTVERRMARYQKQVANANKNRSEVKPIEGGRPKALSLVTKILGRVVGKPFDEYKDAYNHFSTEGIDLRVLTMANDEPKILAFEALEKLASGRCPRFLVFLYLRTNDTSNATCKTVIQSLQKTVGDGLRAAAKHFKVNPPQFEFVELTNDVDMVDYRSLTKWVESNQGNVKFVA